ncbi:unnamed protein product [Cylindrotheca closterium]|uniref:GDT1 family protein n=1 Tax=Cylindrotheca closterium TaxID=2856 RepID=A0AAD2G320_9STRA|nr:unnamed protein product [Cylindrotheca closterium]
MILSKTILAVTAVLALAEISHASTATKSLANAKKTVEDIKKGTIPAFARKPEVISKPSTIKVSKSTTVGFGVLLASTAGLMNGACLSGLISGTGQATTAVTGALTNAGAGFSSGNNAMSIASIKCLLSYIVGSAIAGAFVPRPVAFELRNPGSAALSFVCAAISLLIAAMKAKAGDGTFIFFSLAASGIQNSMTSTFSANLCRTSHFSGTTSDIGTLLGQLLRGNVESLPKLKVLSLLFLSFWAGAFVSVPLGKAYAHNTFLIAAGIYLAVASAIAMSSQTRVKTE